MRSAPAEPGDPCALRPMRGNRLYMFNSRLGFIRRVISQGRNLVEAHMDRVIHADHFMFGVTVLSKAAAVNVVV